jgi:hypothetical protein
VKMRSAADERIGPLAVELVGVMPLTTGSKRVGDAVGEISPVRCRCG